MPHYIVFACWGGRKYSEKRKEIAKRRGDQDEYLMSELEAICMEMERNNLEEFRWGIIPAYMGPDSLYKN